MATSSATAGGRSLAMVDPRAPRFGQTLTAVGTAAFVVTGNPLPLFAVAAVLVTAVLTGWRVDGYAVLWRRVVVPAVGRSDAPEPAAPHRFAKLVGATVTLTASLLVLAGFALPATVLAGLVALLAGIAAAFDICVGCRLYQQVRFFRRLGVV